MKINYVIPKIPLPFRMIIFVLLEAGGIAIQIFYPPLFLLSIVFMVVGSIFLAARNYKNKPLDLGFEDWKPASNVEFERIEQNLKMTKKLSYPYIYKGAFGVFILVILGIFAFISFFTGAFWMLILVLDFAIIFFPVSLTGVVHLWTPSELKMKMECFGTVIQEAKKTPDNLIVMPYLRLDKDKEGRQIPEDIRLMIEPRRKPGDFLGVQIQVAINNGPNGAVPYMYAVFLCRGKGTTFLKLSKAEYGSMIKEPGGDDEYGYIVVRQPTGGGGYHTDTNDCIRLFGIAKEKLLLMP